jgi:hypothetical protein
MALEGWLRGLGLEQYEPAFRKNKIDGSVLPGLTNEDLKDLGVDLVGGRRRLLDAIAAPRATKAPPPEAAPDNSNGEGHRRVPPALGDVLRPRRLDRAIDPTRSGFTKSVSARSSSRDRRVIRGKHGRLGTARIGWSRVWSRRLSGLLHRQRGGRALPARLREALTRMTNCRTRSPP